MNENKEKQISIKLKEETWREFSMICAWYDVDKKDMLQSVLEEYVKKERGNIR